MLAWQAGTVATGVVKRALEKAVEEEDTTRVSILKRGAKFFVLAVMGVILHERNGKTFLNQLKPEVATSKSTERRLENYATVALEWYVEAMIGRLESGGEITTLVRTQDSWSKIRGKVISNWRVYSLSKNVVEDALPKL